MKLPPLYIRLRKGTIYHFHPFCQHWGKLLGREDTVQRDSKPRADLCDECRRKTAADKQAARK